MVMEPPSPQCVGREFVRQYYTLLNQAPLHLHRSVLSTLWKINQTVQTLNIIILQVLLPQLQFRPWRPGHRGEGDGGRVRPAGHPPEYNAAQLPGLSR